MLAPSCVACPAVDTSCPVRAFTGTRGVAGRVGRAGTGADESLPPGPPGIRFIPNIGDDPRRQGRVPFCAAGAGGTGADAGGWVSESIARLCALPLSLLFP